MLDFRESESFKEFSHCRNDREAFKKALDVFSDSGADLRLKKDTALLALKQNEKCLKTMSQLISELSPEAKGLFKNLAQSYAKRVAYENEMLLAINTGQMGPKTKEATLFLEQQLLVEHAAENKLQSADLKSSGLSSLVFFAVLFVLALSFLKNRNALFSGPGVFKTSQEVFLGLFQGSKKTIKLLALEDKAKKENEDKDV